MKKNPLTFKMFLLIVLTDVWDSAAQLLMKMGLAETGVGSVSFSNALGFLSHSASSVLVWLGLLVYTLNFFLWIIVLSRVDLSIAMPVGSVSYILIPFMAIIFFHERVSPLRWTGILLILAGVHFVSKSSQHMPETEPDGL